MIYRIHPAIKKYFCLFIEGKEARKALGEDTDFNIDPSPISYIDEWKPMKIGFYSALNSADTIPDISMRTGKLFLNEFAYKQLRDVLQPHGEFLPVLHDDGNGYIFNCLDIAENRGAVNEQHSMHDSMSDNFSIVFDESKLSDANMFRCEVNLDGLFCLPIVKEIVEREKLTGIQFSIDTGHPFPTDANMIQEH